VEVVQSAQGVAVRLASGEEVCARWAVVTLPCGVLAGLAPEANFPQFSPPLSDRKLLAARRLSMPSRGAPTHEKVVLRWAPDCDFVARVLSGPEAPLQIVTTDRRFHFLNIHRFGRVGQLLCHIWADAEWSQHAELADEAVAKEVVAALRAIYPGDASGHEVVPIPAQFKVTRWSQDPYALGAYSDFQHPEACEEDRTALAEREGRLFFAGEAAVPNMVGAQCTHGAVLSGAAAAVDVLAQLGLRDGRMLDLLYDRGPLGLDVGMLVDALAGDVCDTGSEAEAPAPKRHCSEDPGAL